MKLFVTGATGMLGQDVLRAAERAGHEVAGASRAELDITDERAVHAALGAARPDGVVNCAAWTDVDGAEAHAERALAVNATGAANVARAAAAAGIRVVHVSTDYVFDGRPPHDAAGRPRAYVESDPTGPRSAYGRGKLEGERLVLAASPRHTVVRTAWVFGGAGRNFAATMLKLAEEHDTVKVVSDQVGSPTWTGHLGPALVGLLKRDVNGLVHQAGAGHVSWRGFADEIFRQAEVACRAEPVSTAEMPRPAERPGWSALESERADVLPLPPWQDGLAGYLAARAGMIRA